MASIDMVVYCFDTLKSHFNGHEIPSAKFDIDAKYPLFVTWEIENTVYKTLELRGCIGTLSPTSLNHLRDFTFKSALEDHRFDPIDELELPNLHCSVSLLINYENAIHCEDWIIGIHGIILVLQDPKTKRKYSATYLPDVAKEQGWNHKQTILSLVKKAGYRAKVSQELYETIQITRYQSSKHKLSYAEYLEYKEIHS